MINREEIKKRRQDRGLSLSEAAIAAGWGEMGRTRWHDIEAGRREDIRISTLDQISSALKCNAAQLLHA